VLDLEWYDPGFITTANGSLIITLAAADPTKNHNLNYTGGMMTTWNKFCFSESAYIETKVRLPGSPKVPGLWPAVWTVSLCARTFDGIP
jgi:beta-glucanase (GH16 family)